MRVGFVSKSNVRRVDKRWAILKDRFKLDSVVARHGCCHVAEEQ